MYTSDVRVLNGEVCSVFTNHNCNKYAKKCSDLKLKEPKEKKKRFIQRTKRKKKEKDL